MENKIQHSKLLNIKQQDSYDCGAACLCSIAGWYGVQISLSEARRNCGCSQEGITIRGLIDGAAAIGLSAKGYKTTEKKIDNLLSLTSPIIALMQKEDGSTHFVVLQKVTKTHLNIMDPAEGRIIKLDVEAFLKEWSGYIILLAPTVNTVAGGEKRSKFAPFVKLFKFHRKEIMAALAGSVVITCLGICNSLFLQQLIDNVIPSGDIARLALIATLIISIIPVQLYLSYARTLLLLRNGIKIDTQLIIGFLEKIFRLPMAFFKEHSSGDLTQRITDTQKIRTLVSEGIVTIFISGITLLIVLALMFTMYRTIAYCVLIFIPLYGVLYYVADRFNRKYSRELAVATAKFEEEVIDSIEGAESIKHFGAEAIAAEKYHAAYSALMEKSYKAGKFATAFGVTSGGISQTLLAGVIVCGGISVCMGGLTAGELVAFYTLCTFLISPIVALINMNSTINEAITASNRVFDIIGLHEENSSSNNPVLFASILSDRAKDLAFDDVTFRYPGRIDLINNLSCSFKSGEITAIAGANGSGKSTIGSLILQDITPQSGHITLGGVDINNIGIGDWRKIVSIAPQKGHLFNATILSNITSGCDSPDLERVTKICELTGLDEFCYARPQGILSTVGKNGTAISGGEMQKILIARMLYMNPQIYIFDESTSFMDNGSEKKILELMKKLKESGKCVIIISHKASNLSVADRVITLEKKEFK